MRQTQPPCPPSLGKRRGERTRWIEFPNNNLNPTHFSSQEGFRLGFRCDRLANHNSVKYMNCNRGVDHAANSTPLPPFSREEKGERKQGKLQCIRDSVLLPSPPRRRVGIEVPGLIGQTINADCSPKYPTLNNFMLFDQKTFFLIIYSKNRRFYGRCNNNCHQ
jgi:hypothetical protein